MTEPAILALEDGTIFHGVSVGAPGRTLGEVVFNTAMSGYQEILTDPSYYRQIVTLTYPHIGNVGTNSDDFESTKIYAAGLIIRDLSLAVSSWRAEGGLEQFLNRGKTVAIAEIDTRKLTRIIREKGAQAGCIVTGAKANAAEAIKAARKFPGLKGMDLARLVSTKQPYQWNQGSIFPERRSVYTKRVASFHVAALDYGIKRNILRLIADQDCRLTVLPATATADEVLALAPDGVFLSNGPGDPEPCDYAIEAIAQARRRRRPDLRHLPRTSASRARERREDRKDEVRPSRRQPPGGRDRLRARDDHVPESRVCGQGGHTAGERARDAPIVVRRHAPRHRADRPAGLFLSGPPGSEPWTARLEAAVRALHRGDEGAPLSSPSGKQIDHIKQMITILYLESRLDDAAPRRHRERSNHRGRADRDRPGLRVRLLGHAGLQGAQGGRLPSHPRQLEPSNHHDGPRKRGRDLYRADPLARRRGDHREGATRRRCCRRWADRLP